jgi:radical SAM-linked protein
MQRVRIEYSKGRELQYTGNLDMHKVWERTFRRARLPLAYSQGFHPQPKLQQAAPLPLGFTSSAEIVDVWFDTDEPLEVLTQRITETAQPGIQVRRISLIPPASPALPNLVNAAAYRITCDDPLPETEIQVRMEHVLAATTLPRERRGKGYDLRPLVQSLTLEALNPLTLAMILTSLPSATGRPEEVLEELHIDPFTVDIERTQLLFAQS